ncbi:hypothetical protein BDY24DRAFT_442974 [Mrakia frigida]|uniref:uncharacterized protein n=1 Tax=Mrakia frigida TaxID=29902 RepID=UPI003FCC0903
MAFGFSSPRPKSRTSAPPLNSTSNISSPLPLPDSPTTFYPSRIPPPPSSVSPAPPVTSRIPISPNSRLPPPKTRAPDPSTPPLKSKTVPPLTPPPTSSTSRIPARPKPPPSTTTPPTIAKRILRKPSTGANFLQRLTSPASLPSSSSNKSPTPKSLPATSPPPSQPSKLPVLGLAIEWEKPLPTAVALPSPSPVNDASHDEFETSDKSDGIASYYHSSRSRSASAAFGRNLEREENSRRWSRELGEGTLKFGMERVLKLDERAGRDEDGDTPDGSRREFGGGRREVVRLDSTESVPRLNEFGVLEARFRSGQGDQPSSSPIRGFSRSLPARSSSPGLSNGGGPQISAAFGTRRSISISISPFLSSSSLSVASSSTSSSGAPVYFLNGIPREGGVGGESRRGSIRASTSSPSSFCSSTFGDTRRSESPSPSPRQDPKTLSSLPDQEEESPSSTPPSAAITPPSTRTTYTPFPLPTTTTAPSSPPLSPLSSASNPLPPPKLHRTISPPKSLASTRRPSSPPPPPPPHKLRSTRPIPPAFPPSVSFQTLLSDSAVADQEGWSVSISTSSSPAPVPEGSISFTIVLSPPKSTQHQPQTPEHPTPLLTPSNSPQLAHSKLSSSSPPSSTRPSTLPTSPTSPSPSHSHPHSFGFISTGGTWKAPTRATMVNLVLPLSLGERGTGAGAGGGRLTFLSLPRGERGSV